MKGEIADRHGHLWEVWVTVPEDHGRGPSHGPDEPTATLNTPNEADHAFYGEDGPTFTVADLLRVVGHRCGLPDSIQEALNSGDGTYRP
jgi:hypothetical protein